MKVVTHDGDGFVGEVTGVDCVRTGRPEIDRLRDLLFEHRVLVLRDQRLTPAEYLRFMTGLGRPVRHVLQNLTLDGFPDILQISDHVHPDGTPSGVLDGGSFWHSDMSYLPGLGVATALYAVRAVPRSGGTSFVDMVGGRSAVGDDADLLAELGCRTVDDARDVEVIHRFGNRRARTDTTAASQTLSADQARTLRETRHRLVERHPATGRPALFATSGSAMELAGRSSEDSARVLDLLEGTVLRDAATYTHRYRPGDLVVWDNMTTMHRGVDVRATGDVRRSRLLYRVNIRYSGEDS